jgi:transcriptional regulator with XRE-family HTH domain
VAGGSRGRSPSEAAAAGHDAFGVFVRTQRELAELTLRQAAQLARISNPYLSQIENGLALPSIAVMAALADALSVSVESMVRAATPSGAAGTRTPTEDAVRVDPRLSTAQKHALLTVLASFTAEPARAPRSSGRNTPRSTPRSTTRTRRTPTHE